MPVLTVDIIVKHKGKYLLVKRLNEPLKGMYYLPGGRVYKGEHTIVAAKRKLKEETGLTAKNLKFYGYSDGIFKKNDYGLLSVHTTSIIFLCTKFIGSIKLDAQSSAYKWSAKLPNKWIKRK
jgi:ADP-ribose pyrophosphatase YjhB (NUDIX family)